MLTNPPNHIAAGVQTTKPQYAAPPKNIARKAKGSAPENAETMNTRVKPISKHAEAKPKADLSAPPMGATKRNATRALKSTSEAWVATRPYAGSYDPKTFQYCRNTGSQT